MMYSLIESINKLGQALLVEQNNQKVKDSITEALKVAVTELYEIVKREL